MQKSRKVHPFEKRLWLLEEALEHKMDKTDGEDFEERLSDLEANHEGLESKLEDVDFKLDDGVQAGGAQRESGRSRGSAGGCRIPHR